jgi:hypothetical protein
MSLIADALKRAKAAQQTAPRADPAAVLYQQADPKASRPARKGIFLPAGLLVLTLVALFAVWLGFRKNSAGTPIAATATPPAPAVVAPKPVPAVPEPAPAAATVASTLVPAPQAPIAAPPTPAPIAAEPQPPAKSPEPAVEPAPQNPPPLRLQAIFFSPSHPWAMIGGKTIYVGDQVGDFKVVAIAAESATLVSAGQTNILTVSR